MNEQLQLLLIDDDEDDRDLFEEAVKEVDENIQCITFSDSESGLAYLKDKNNRVPDYIFLDQRMPRISGRKCLVMIREDERLKEVPVIIYTTSNNEEDSAELMELGATHFTTKPTNPEEIYYIVSVILNEQW